MANKSWRVAYWLLTALFVLTAVLNLMHVHGGFLTNHAADLVVPAWMYVIVRGLAGHRHRLASVVGRSPEIAAIVLFLASTGTELSQRWWPHGIFPGRYDIWDIASYGGGLAICYVADRISDGRINRIPRFANSSGSRESQSARVSASQS